MDIDDHLINLFQNLREISLARLENTFLIITLGDHQYGLESRLVTEIVSIDKMLQGPDIPTYVKGMLNWHGSSIPVLDIRTKPGFLASQYDQNACIAVMNLNGQHVGLVVDQTNKIAPLEEEQFLAAPAT